MDDFTALLLIIFMVFLIVSWSWYFWHKYRFLKSCPYKAQEQPGEACVTCPHNKKCGRAIESEVYKLYRRIELLNPDRAKEILNEIQNEQEKKD